MSSRDWKDRSPGVGIPASLDDLDGWLATSEARVPDLREGAAKAIVWAGEGPRTPTPRSVIYLHGFSADPREIDPLPRQVAEGMGANLFYARLTGHGRAEAAMAEASMDDWLADAEEAMALGVRLGGRVVVMGTSTGGTLALWLAARTRWRERMAALVLLSPNLRVRNRAAALVRGAWGRLLLRAAVGREYRFEPQNEAQARHWTTRYPSSSLLPMIELTRTVRRLPLEKVNVPVFVAYSPLDRVVDPRSTLTALERLTSPVKRRHVVRDDGDAQHHVLAGDILSPGTTAGLAAEILDFLEHLP